MSLTQFSALTLPAADTLSSLRTSVWCLPHPCLLFASPGGVGKSYDKWSYAYCDMSGSRVHQSERVDDYGESFGPGDVIGCAIYLLPPTIPQAVGGEALDSAAKSDGSGGAGGVDGADGADSVDGGADIESATVASHHHGEVPPEVFADLPAESHIRFYRNGVDQGVAYRGIPARAYYPAVSVYMGGRVRANFGPIWLTPPLGAASSLPSGTTVGSEKSTSSGGGSASPNNIAAAASAAVRIGALRAIVADLRSNAEILEHEQMVRRIFFEGERGRPLRRLSETFARLPRRSS